MDKKTLRRVIPLVILVLLLPIGIFLVKQTQTFFSQADNPKIELADGKCVVVRKGKKVLNCGEVPIKLSFPIQAPSPSPTPSTTTSASPTGSGSPQPSSSTPSVKLTINNDEGPVNVDAGSSVVLKWVTNQVRACEASEAWSGQKNDNGATETISNIQSPKTFTLTCEQRGNPDNKVSDSITVIVGNGNSSIRQTDPSKFEQDLKTIRDLGGGVLYIPSGSYTLPKGFTIYSNTTLIGDGKGQTKLKLPSGVDSKVISTSGEGSNTGIVIRDLSIEGPGVEGPKDDCCYGIRLRNIKNSYVVNVEVSGFSQDGIYLGAVSNKGTDDTRITGCDVHDNGRNGISIVHGQRNSVDNCNVSNNGLKEAVSAIDIEPDGGLNVSNNVIMNNTVTNNRGNGIGLGDNPHDPGGIVSNNGVCGNTFSGNGFAEIAQSNDQGTYTSGCQIPSAISNIPSAPAKPSAINKFSDKLANLFSSLIPKVSAQDSPTTALPPTLNRVEPSCNGNHLYWTKAPDDHPQTTDYIPHRDGLPFKTIGGDNYLDGSEEPSKSQLKDNTRYCYTIHHMRRPNGPLGVSSNEICITTPTCGRGAPPQCSDDTDNDGDSKTDQADPGCHKDGDPNNGNSYDPLDNDEAEASVAECKDGADNDSDSKIDSADPGCHSDGDPDNEDSFNPDDNSEEDEAEDELTECNDSLDNDDDNKVDTSDPNCHTDGDADNPSTYDPSIKFESRAYRLSETEAGLAGATYKFYTEDPLLTVYQLVDAAPGTKQVWVQFRDENGNLYKDHITIDIVGPDPEISSVKCDIDSITKNNIQFTVKGTDFGDKQGSGDLFLGINISEEDLKNNKGTDLEMLSWKNDELSILQKKPTLTPQQGQRYKVLVLRDDGAFSNIASCDVGLSGITLGARVFCREEGKFDVSNVKVTVYEYDKTTKKLNKIVETVSIDKDGVVKGLKTTIQTDKVYALSIKAPNSLARVAIFKAEEGTTVVTSANGGEFILPIGDIAPKTAPDGKINTADRSELTIQWRVLSPKVATNSADTKPSEATKSGDFNRDTKVNSVDWACMRYDFNKEDEVINEAALVEEMEKEDPKEFVPSRIYSIPGRTSGSGGTSSSPTPAPAGNGKATLSLNPATRATHTTCSIQTEIVLDTAGRDTDGADVQLNYNPDEIIVTSISNGGIYDRYPGKTFDNDTGEINISGISSVSTPYKGKGIFATINFRVSPLAENTEAKLSEVKFDFDPANKSKTTDTNVVERGTVKELLDSVTNGSYFIDPSKCD